jgi:hypothetical protein
MTQPSQVPTNGTLAAPTAPPVQTQPAPAPSPDAPEPIVFAVFSVTGTWALNQLLPTGEPFRIIQMVPRENGDVDVFAKSEGENNYVAQKTSAMVTIYARSIERVVTLARDDVWLDMLREENEPEEPEEKP